MKTKRAALGGLLLACAVLRVDGAAAQSAGGDEWFSCLIKPNSLVNVGFPVWGVVEHIGVERGDFLQKGQQLAELESGVERATVRINQARLEFAERKRRRTQELTANGHVSDFDVDQANTERELAALELERSQETLNQRTIRSPIAGVVVQRMVSPGEYVQEAPVLQLAGIDPLQVEVVLPVTWFGRVSVGDRAVIRPENPVEGEFDATVTIVDRLVDAASGTLGVTLELANPGNRLPAGLKCLLHFSP